MGAQKHEGPAAVQRSYQRRRRRKVISIIVFMPLPYQSPPPMESPNIRCGKSL